MRIRQYLLIILLTMVTSSLIARDSNVKERQPSLPDVVIACGYLAGFQSVSLPSDTRCPEVWKAINTAGADALAFSHSSYLVQTAIQGNIYGFVRKPNQTLDQSGVPDVGLLFVTDSIAELGGKVLVISAQVGPEKTTIFTLDKDLHPTVLYDSLSQPALANLTSPMGSVYQVRVLGPTRFLLQERRLPGGALTATSNRAFLLDVSKGEIKLSVDKR